MSKTRQIVLEMLSQRDYKIIEDTKDVIIAEKKGGEKICVFMTVVPKFNIESQKDYSSQLSKLNINHCIAIYRDGTTPLAKKTVKKLIETGMEMELFKECELQYNITKHRLVPLHRKVSPEESVVYKKKFSLKIATMNKTYPIAKFYNYKKGDIIEVTRPGGIIAYRIVK